MQSTLIPPAATVPTLTVDLNALVANYRFLVQQSSPAACAAVVKTNAYGLGVVPISKALWGAGCKSFFIATPACGAQLHALLPEAEIFVFHGVGTADEAAYAAEHKLTPILSTHKQLELWRNEAKKRGQLLPSALQVDTGINRLGFTPEDVLAIAKDASALDGLELTLVMSHLACSYQPDHPLTHHQREVFPKILEAFPRVRGSLVNSAGVFYSKADCLGLARPGGALYGLNPPPAGGTPMQCVATLQAPVLQIHTLKEDGTVGYNATYEAKAGTRLATLAIGYADGLIFAMTNKGKLWAAGCEVPIVGKVSMDLTIIDITHLPENALKEGDLVEVYGPNRSFQKLAEDADTAGYELLTSLGPRVHRRYVGGEG